MKTGADPRDFSRKARALQDLAQRGKLYKSEAPLRSIDTREYRKNILAQAKKQHLPDDRYAKLENLLEKMDVDHLHELQLGGIDHTSAMWMLDKGVNRSIGAQIMHQLKDLPVGTYITKLTF
ncbi:MAG: hypothetical protein C0582_01640 [Alphaproteobacteria bacterium]|nr:MAG: hypothetical protein C0582_01640 [Alphaproteobacteria bacterium]